MKKIILALIIGIFLISFISAECINYPNYGDWLKPIPTNYLVYNVTFAFGENHCVGIGLEYYQFQPIDIYYYPRHTCFDISGNGTYQIVLKLHDMSKLDVYINGEYSITMPIYVWQGYSAYTHYDYTNLILYYAEDVQICDELPVYEGYVQPILGCMDIEAINYYPESTEDDRSCVFREVCTSEYEIITGNEWVEVEWTNNIFEYVIDYDGVGGNSVRAYYTDPISGYWMDEKWLSLSEGKHNITLHLNRIIWSRIEIFVDGDYYSYITIPHHQPNFFDKATIGNVNTSTYMICDEEPLEIYNLLPNGTIYNNSTTLSIQTNNPAICRYELYDPEDPPGGFSFRFYDEDGNPIPSPIFFYHPSYSQLSNDFSTSNNLLSTSLIENLDVGYYSYFVVCQDVTNSSNEVLDYLSFSVEEPLTITVIEPIEFLSKSIRWDDSSPILITNKPAICSYQQDYCPGSNDPAGVGGQGIGVCLTFAPEFLSSEFSLEHFANLWVNQQDFSCTDRNNNTVTTEKININYSNFLPVFNFITPTINDNFNYDNTWINSEQNVILIADEDERGAGVVNITYCLDDDCQTIERGSDGYWNEETDECWSHPLQNIGGTFGSLPWENLSGVGLFQCCFDYLKSQVPCSYGGNIGYFLNWTSFQINFDLNETKNITYYATNNLGNISEIGSFISKIDLIMPVTTDNSPNGIQNSSFNILLSVTDDSLSPIITYYKIWKDDEPTIFIQGNLIPITENGYYNIKYYSEDLAGNVEGIKEINVELNIIEEPENMTYTPTNPEILEIINKIEGLKFGTILNISILNETNTTLPDNIKVYRFLNITTNQNTSATISFKLNKSETENPENISLYILENDWEELNTTLINESEYYKYKIYTPHFSLFMIAESLVEEDTDDEDTIDNGNNGNSGGSGRHRDKVIEELEPDVEEEESEEEEQEPGPIDLIEEETKNNLVKYILIGLFSMVVIILIIFCVLKKKKEEKIKDLRN